MINVTLIKDEANYQKEHLERMAEIFTRNFIHHHNPELQKRFAPTDPEIRIHVNIPKGVVPEVMFAALGRDLYDTINKQGFMTSFLSPDSEEVPSLVFHFEGTFRSFEFRIQSTDEKTISEATGKVMEELLGIIKAEDLPPEIDDIQILNYEDGKWVD